MPKKSQHAEGEGEGESIDIPNTFLFVNSLYK